MPKQLLFAYGTLKSDQPEHAIHCERPLAIAKGRAAGSLWKLREGYPILQIDPAFALLDATGDPVADWNAASAMASLRPPPNRHQNWIEGEIFAYPLNGDVMARMDAWENFRPGISSPYQRRAIWIKDARDEDLVAWAYVCYSPPNWATLLEARQWPAPS